MNKLCEQLGIDFPLFAFSHCRDVVAAVSKAGGMGVLGAIAHTPDELEAELAWIDAGLRSGPLVVEPFVQITRETTRCAWLSREGALTIAGPGFQTTTPTGGWVDTAPVEARAIDDTDDARLLHALEVAGRALHADGYFGPYGIDAFWHRPLDGSPGEALNPLSEINARLTMDWNLPRAGV